MQHRILNGVRTFAPQSRSELIQYAFDNQGILVAVNAEKILHATDDTRQIISRNIGYPDGVGAVWALQKKGCENVVKIPGCELWLDIISQYHQTKTFYFVGAKEEIIENVVKKISQQFSGIKILNYRNGYLRNDQEKQELIDDIVSKKPEVIFVAMGSPKQELLMEEIHKYHPALYQGLGGSFDVYEGIVKRAPNWWVRNNLEWAYRLLMQPTRIKRQIHLVKFFALLHLNKF